MLQGFILAAKTSFGRTGVDHPPGPPGLSCTPLTRKKAPAVCSGYKLMLASYLDSLSLPSAATLHNLSPGRPW